jgi:hypothetical protein
LPILKDGADNEDIDTIHSIIFYQSNSSIIQSLKLYSFFFFIFKLSSKQNYFFSIFFFFEYGKILFKRTSVQAQGMPAH